jgi:hypothetical protein
LNAERISGHHDAGEKKYGNGGKEDAPARMGVLALTLWDP